MYNRRMDTNELLPEDIEDIRRFWYFDGELNDGVLVLLGIACAELANRGIITPYEDTPLTGFANPDSPYKPQIRA